jgi:hypothetical protein
VLAAEQNSVRAVRRLRTLAVLCGEFEPGETHEVLSPIFPPFANIQSNIMTQPFADAPNRGPTQGQVGLARIHAEAFEMAHERSCQDDLRSACGTALLAALAPAKEHVEAVLRPAVLADLPPNTFRVFHSSFCSSLSSHDCDLLNIPTAAACSQARCHTSAWDRPRVSILFSPFDPVTSQTAP